MVGDEGVARVLAFEVGGEREALGLVRRHILHRMYGEVGTALEQCGFELLHEQALAARL